MYSKFKYVSVPLKDIQLDDRNPRIVTQTKLSSQNALLKYLYEYGELADFTKKIAAEGKNRGAERPYVIQTGNSYTVIEGNTRIAAYKVLTGLLTPPKEFLGTVPAVSKGELAALSKVECSVAPNRDALLPIMANAHFGQGDKSKWGYLGSRKAVYDEWKSGKSVAQLAKAFDRTKTQINDLILEYMLYLKAISFSWSPAEKVELLNPAVEFNPPIRFLQSSGHRDKVGITFDRPNLKLLFANLESERKFKHLIKKLVISPEPGLGATAKFDEVFQNYKPQGGKVGAKSGGNPAAAPSAAPSVTAFPVQLKPGALFDYPVTVNNGLIRQLMKEAKNINAKGLPASGTFLLRNVVEAIVKHIIHDQKANPKSQSLDLEGALNLCMSKSVSLPQDDRKVLKEFKNSHLDYLNLGAHGTVIPNSDRLLSVRDCVDLFVKRNV